MIVSFSPSLNQLLLYGHILIICDNEKGMIRASEIKREKIYTYIYFFEKSGIYPFPP